MKKILSNIMILSLLALLFVSCNLSDDSMALVLNPEKASVKFVPSIAHAKGLSSSDDPDFVWLEYQATPAFDAQGAVISGTVNGANWKKIESKDTGKETYTTEAVFTQGLWNFEIRVGKGQDVFYTGTAQAYLTSSANTIPVDLVPFFDAKKTGSVTINLSTPLLSPEDAGNFSIVIYDSTLSTMVTTAKDGQSAIDFSNFSPDATKDAKSASLNKTISMVPGIYIMEVQYSAGGASTEKSVIAFKVIGGNESTISGTIENGSYISGTVSLSKFNGIIAEDENNKGTYIFTPSASYSGTVQCYWYENGVQKAGPVNSYAFSGTISGTYCLTCVAIYTDTDNNKDVVSVSELIQVK